LWAGGTTPGNGHNLVFLIATTSPPTDYPLPINFFPFQAPRRRGSSPAAGRLSREHTPAGRHDRGPPLVGGGGPGVHLSGSSPTPTQPDSHAAWVETRSDGLVIGAASRRPSRRVVDDSASSSPTTATTPSRSRDRQPRRRRPGVGRWCRVADAGPSRQFPPRRRRPTAGDAVTLSL